MQYHVTVRYGTARKRYHLVTIEEADLPAALRRAADEMPEDVAAVADLAEIRPAVDAESRSYVGDDP